MGFFSWVTSDTNESIPNTHSCRKTFPVYVLIPTEFGGGMIEEPSYEGYGDFGGRDIYDLVADWNRASIDADALIRPDRGDYARDQYGDVAYDRAMERHRRNCSMFADFAGGADDASMISKYGEDFRRTIGLLISFSDTYAAPVKFSIKIVKNPVLAYEGVSPSKICPFQGYFFPEHEECWEDDE